MPALAIEAPRSVNTESSCGSWGELGVSPLAETVALSRAIESGQGEPSMSFRERGGTAGESLGDLHTRHGDHQAGHRDEAERELRRAARLFSEIGGEPTAMEPEVWELVQW
jgi:hypothetical protein